MKLETKTVKKTNLVGILCNKIYEFMDFGYLNLLIIYSTQYFFRRPGRKKFLDPKSYTYILCRGTKDLLFVLNTCKYINSKFGKGLEYLLLRKTICGYSSKFMV